MSANIDSRIISALWVVAILALLMSWVIFINFQITQSVERAKEMGLKKVVGASSSSLRIQIVLQSVLMNAVGMGWLSSCFLFSGNRLAVTST
jgi:putative ABC transport system permease protein